MPSFESLCREYDKYMMQLEEDEALCDAEKAWSDYFGNETQVHESRIAKPNYHRAVKRRENMRKEKATRTTI